MFEDILITLFYYFFITAVVRVLGKREIAQLGVLDLVIFLIIADVCAIGIENGDLTLAIGISVIAVVEKLLSFVLLKFSPLRKIIDGKERVVIRNGEILYKNMKKELYTMDDLLSQLRLNDITNIKEVKLAILETDGRMTLCRNNDDILLPVIQNGKIVKENLTYFSRDEKWVLNNVNNIKEIFCGFIVKDKLLLIRKDELLTKKQN